MNTNTPDRRSERSSGTAPAARDLLAAYELGLLDQATAARVEEALAGDPDLLEELYTGAPVAGVLRDEPERLAQRLRRAARAEGAPADAPWWRRWWRRPAVSAPALLLPVAACLVLLAVRVPGPPAAAARLLPRPLPYTALSVRGDAGPSDRLFQAAMRDYAAGRYGRAAALLARARAAASAEWERAGQAALYHGVALLLAGHPARARAPLAEAAADPLPPVSQRARWYLAQAAALAGDPAAARAELEHLRRSPVFAARADSLRRLLETP